jgi:methylenetetrahydrofolate reductase (NADPH)
MSKIKNLSFEFFPPRTLEGEKKLWTTLEALSLYSPEFFSVTFGAGGSTKEKTFETVIRIKEKGFNAVPHISCISSSKEEIRSLLEEYKSNNINHLVCLRGDNPSGLSGAGEFHHANDLVSFVRKETGDHFYIEVAAYPEVHPEAESANEDLRYFKEKVESGANSAITQFFFNVDAYFKFVEQCNQQQINVPVIPGIMPIYNIKQLSRFANSCGAEIPRWLRLKLESYGDDINSLRDFGVDFISELCETLLAFGVDSLHFYTLNEHKIISRIIENISD